MPEIGQPRSDEDKFDAVMRTAISGNWRRAIRGTATVFQLVATVAATLTQTGDALNVASVVAAASLLPFVIETWMQGIWTRGVRLLACVVVLGCIICTPMISTAGVLQPATILGWILVISVPVASLILVAIPEPELASEHSNGYARVAVRVLWIALIAAVLIFM